MYEIQNLFRQVKLKTFRFRKLNYLKLLLKTMQLLNKINIV